MAGTTLEIVTGIFVALIVIGAADISTPLGFSVWILYFIPLFLTLYWDSRNSPFFVTGIIILLIAVSFFLSPRDIPPLFAFLNRLFFSAMLVVSAILIWHFKRSGENLKKSEANYRILTEWSPVGVIVYRDGSIRYANRAFLHLFDPDPAASPVGRDLLDLVLPEQREIVRERIRQAANGAQVEEPGIRITAGRRETAMDMIFREVCWDRVYGVMILTRLLS